MRHLHFRLLMPAFCMVLAACGTPPAPQASRSFTLEPGQPVVVEPGLTLTLDAVEDSRCPPGMRCAWAGELSYRFRIRRNGGTLDTFTLSPREPGVASPALGGRRVVLNEASLPAPAAPGAVVHHRIGLTMLPR